MKKPYHFHRGDSPILISIPHAGTHIPKDIACNFTPLAQHMPDVDWHLPLLYDMARTFSATTLAATHMRYVIDLNRASDHSPLYPNQDTTALCPIDTFDKHAIYSSGKEPNLQEIQNRINNFWQPYHTKLEAELNRIHSLHGIALLWDAHSIASHVPRFFSGKLPDLNFGTAKSQSCAASLEVAIASLMQQSAPAQKFSHVFNGRFKGGYITCHYGQPTKNVHAIQLELSQCTYMQETSPYTYNSDSAKNLKLLISDLLDTCLIWANQQKEIYNLPSSPI